MTPKLLRWWRGKRDVKLFNRQTIMGRAERITGESYLLTVPAYSMKGRFVSIAFSSDGQNWSAPEPYRVQHDCTARAGTNSVWVRLDFKGPDGVAPQEPIRIEL